ncbi:hypothetical protein VP01_7859g1, partial [Puccinia sorghi]
ADAKPIMSFTGTLAHIKAKEVANHLHLRSDKAQGVQILREKACLVLKRDVAQENLSDLSGTDDKKRALMISKAVLGAHPLPLPTQQRAAHLPSSIFNNLAYKNANWITFSSTCLPSPDYLCTLRAIRNIHLFTSFSHRRRSRLIGLNLSGAGSTPTSPFCTQRPSCCSVT